MRYQIKHALVQFGADVILQDVNFEVHDKEKIAIVGRNGTASGKNAAFREEGTGVNGKNSIQTGTGIQGGNAASDGTPTLSDVFDKKTYYNPLKIISRLERQLEKYEKQLEEDEQRAAELQMQLMAPELASDYTKLMELQNAVDALEHDQETLLERILETETELAEHRGVLSKQ